MYPETHMRKKGKKRTCAKENQPNDDTEQDRMDLAHHISRLLLGGELFRAPIAENPQRVLDLGTGTGIWAMDFAEFVPPAMVDVVVFLM